MAGKSAGYRRLLARLQGSYQSSSGVAKGPSVPYTGEALLRNNGVASTSARDLHPRCTASRPFVSSAAAFAAEGGLPTSPTLRAKKEYRQQRRQQERPPPVPAYPVAGPTSAWPRQAPVQASDWEEDEEEEEEEEEEGELMTTDRSMTELEDSDILQYFSLPPSALPEAFPEHNKSPAIAMLPKTGCKGLLDEYEATGQEYVMYRPYIHALIRAIESQQVKQLLLDGMPGAGKSVVMAALAHWARQAGWVVLYLANAEVLTDGGFYSFNEAAGGWDTPQAAQYILHNVLASHKDALAALKTADGARSLAEVASEGVESTIHAVSVDAALAVLEGLHAQSEVPVMVAVDRYNALHTESFHGQTINDHKRRMIPAAELRLACAMRVLERDPPPNGVHLAAPARHDRISQRTPMTLGGGCKVVEIPRFLQVEWQTALEWYDATAVLHQDSIDAMQSFMMCQGNARELRSVGEGLNMQYSTVQYHDRH